jgi:WD40 repeat protein
MHGVLHRPTYHAHVFSVLLLATALVAAQESSHAGQANQVDDPDYSLVVQAGQGSDIQRIVLDHRGQQMATVSMDGGIRVWDVARRQEVWDFSGRQGVNSFFAPVAFSPDDKTLAVAQGTIIHFFSLITGQAKDIALPLHMPTCLTFSSDGSHIAAGSLGGHIDLVSVIDGNIESLYDPKLPSNQEIQEQSARGEMVEFVSSLFLVDSMNRLVAGTNKGTINTFDLVAARKDPQAPPVSSVHVDGVVGAFGLTSDGLVAAGTSFTWNAVRIWRVADQKLVVEKLDCNSEAYQPNYALSEKGDLAATGCVDKDAKIFTYQLWTLPSGKEIPLPKALRGVNIHNPTAIAAGGSVLAMPGNDRRLSVLDLKSGLPLMEMEESPVNSVEIIQSIPKTHELAISTRTQTSIWKNNGTTTVQTRYAGTGPYALSPDGTWMAYFDSGYQLHVVDRTNDKELATPIKEPNAEEYARHNAGFYNFRIAVSSEGPTVFWMEGGGFSGYAKFWKAGDNTGHILCETGNKGELVVSPLSTYVALGCNRGQIGFQSSHVLLLRVRDMRVVDEEYGDLKNSLQGIPFRRESTVTGIAFTNDERRYFMEISNEIESRSIGGNVFFPPMHSDLSAGRMYVGPIAIDKDNKFIATQTAVITLPESTFSEQIEILNTEGKSLNLIKLPTICKSMVFLSNLLAVGLQDGTTTLYSVPDLKPMVTLVHPDGWVAVAPNGLFDGNAEALHWVGWRARNQRAIVPLDLLYDNYFRPDLLNAIVNDGYAPLRESLASELGLGSLELMMEQGYAYLEPARDATVLCFTDRPQELDLYSDGAPLSFAASQIERGTSATCPWLVKIPKSAAKIESAKRRTSGPRHCPTVTRPAPDHAPQGTLHVLTIAITIQGPGSTYPALPSAVPSAVALEKLFSTQGTGPGHLFRGIVVEPGLRDGGVPPTLENIRNSWSKMAKSVKPDDTVFLFLSGHALVPPGTESFYFVPFDFDPASLSTMRNTGLSIAMLADMLRAIPARRIVIVIDACQSGAAVASLAKIADVKANVERARDHNRLVGVYVLASATALQLATASPKDEVGSVAQAVLDLAAGGEMNSISAGQVVDRICTNLLSKTDQTPIIHSSGNNFYFLERHR